MRVYFMNLEDKCMRIIDFIFNFKINLDLFYKWLEAKNPSVCGKTVKAISVLPIDVTIELKTKPMFYEVHSDTCLI